MQLHFRNCAFICAVAFALWSGVALGSGRQVSPLLVERGPWVGAVTATSAVVKLRVAHEGALTRVSYAAAGGGAAFTEFHKAGQTRLLGFDLKNLKASTHYLYNVEVDGRFDRANLGQFTTFPEGPASFTFAFAS